MKLLLFLLVGMTLNRVSAQCVDTAALALLKSQFQSDPLLFWEEPTRLNDGSKLAFFYAQLDYLGKRLPIARKPAKYEHALRIWKWSEWHYEGDLWELRYRRGRWQLQQFSFNEAGGFRYRRQRSQLQSDSLQAFLKRYPLDLLPQQPTETYHCPPLSTVYAYMVEVWRGGEYRFYCYQDPERYAEQGSWIDAFFLQAIGELK